MKRLARDYHNVFKKIANPKVIFLLIFILALYAFFQKSFFGFATLFVIAGLSMVWKRKARGIPIGFELVTFTTVIAATVHGPLVGALFGLLAAIAAQAGANDFDAGMVFYFAGSIAVGIISAFLPFSLLAKVAAMSLLSDLFTQFLPLMGGYEQRFVAAIYITSHLIINIAVVNLVGAPLLRFVS